MAAGLLLTGGASTRMGVDKAAIEIGGERLADRGARVLGAVCDPVLEVGRGYTGLETVQEDPPGTGPLAALAAGGAALRRRGHKGPAVLLAIDLPFITIDFIRYLVGFPGSDSVVPFVRGEPQPVCARYSPEAMVLAADAVRRGERSIRELLRLLPEIQWTGPRMWGAVADERVLADVDTPEDLRTLGLPVQGGMEQ